MTRFRISFLPLCALVLGLILGGCAAPSPHPTLAGLYRVSEGEQQQELGAEIARLCGHLRDGEVPASCTPEGTDTFLTESSTQDFSADTAGILNIIADIPQESLPLIVDQYLFYATTNAEPISQVVVKLDIPAAAQRNPDGTAPQQEPDPETHSHNAAFVDLVAAREALRREYGFLYALGMATAFADDMQDQRIAQLEKVHQRIADSLEFALNEDAFIPVPAAGYSFDDLELPYDDRSAAAFVDELVASNERDWQAFASQAHHAPWRTTSLSTLGYLTNPQ
ncbi:MULTISPECIES: DUF4439 domain-containing protein [unclassified Corynebacterium]|uniref:DUF4439 domain-containing protein n=1 Tax=unclassified Corynebacterium TaxID=2624378 RepID=UPI002167632B|nr:MULTISPECIES: DUF4439 domain-containing protein [unclassified Corynebacterium]MCS4489120.1 DUF4439 domain-containing protein [Corynebacterium sp. ES2775-CONJ]MCS4490933.1 DUF4439 domain-containing protein [Corynebacterium sp. ES2715-CONJ3]MCS4531185.1 DUF4439 domain-containing protein [Corynebacterium sp. ES2730-CONJ]